MKPAPRTARLGLARRGLAAAILTPWFLKELVKSCLLVARDCLRPKLALAPAIVRMPLEPGKSDAEIFLLSSLITLTPGTLTLDVAPDRSFLSIHTLYGQDPDAVIRELKSGMERRVHEVFRR